MIIALKYELHNFMFDTTRIGHKNTLGLKWGPTIGEFSTYNSTAKYQNMAKLMNYSSF